MDSEGSTPADGGGSSAGGKLGAGVGDGRHAGRWGIGGGALGGGDSGSGTLDGVGIGAARWAEVGSGGGRRKKTDTPLYRARG